MSVSWQICPLMGSWVSGSENLARSSCHPGASRRGSKATTARTLTHDGGCSAGRV
jgi:hypothetical protein